MRDRGRQMGADGGSWKARAVLGAAGGMVAAVLGLSVPLFVATVSRLSGTPVHPAVGSGLMILCLAPSPGLVGGPILGIPLNGLIWGWMTATMGNNERRTRLLRLATWTVWACWVVMVIAVVVVVQRT